MERKIEISIAIVLVIIAFTVLPLVWASSTSQFLFTQKLTLENNSQTGPTYFENGPAYQAFSDITYLGKRIAQVEVMVGPPYVNSSEIPIIFKVTQGPNYSLDSVEVAFASSVHKPLTYQPDFYLKPTYKSNVYSIELYTTPQWYANEVVLEAKALDFASDEWFYQELIFSPVNPDVSKPLEFYFNLSIAMHENSLIPLTSLKLESNITLNADALLP